MEIAGSLHHDSIPFTVLCQALDVAKSVVDLLEARGFHHDPYANVCILVDSPRGFALHILEAGGEEHRRLIVVTRQTCPEYLEDLWDFQPAVLLLLIDNQLAHMLPKALQRAANGDRYRFPANVMVRLTPSQRQTLRYVAQAWTDKQIAQHLSLTPGTVRNRVLEIKAELGFKNRNQLILYYWGISTYGDPMDTLS